jgi:hypothetical protein
MEAARAEGRRSLESGGYTGQSSLISLMSLLPVVKMMRLPILMSIDKNAGQYEKINRIA